MAQRSLESVLEQAGNPVEMLRNSQLGESEWLAGDTYTLADINFYAHCGMMVERMFPDLAIATRAPRLVAWRDRMTARPGVAASLAMPDHTAPGLRTWTGHVR